MDEEQEWRDRFADLEDHDAWLDERDRHLPEDGSE